MAHVDAIDEEVNVMSETNQNRARPISNQNLTSSNDTTYNMCVY
jgi:hypothetical protein